MAGVPKIFPIQFDPSHNKRGRGSRGLLYLQGVALQLLSWGPAQLDCGVYFSNIVLSIIIVLFIKEEAEKGQQLDRQSAVLLYDWELPGHSSPITMIIDVSIEQVPLRSLSLFLLISKCRIILDESVFYIPCIMAGIER